MVVQLNHTIVAAEDKVTSARFLADILGLAEPRAVSHFVAVELGNGVTLDFDDAIVFTPQHYAFLVTDDEFDPILARVRAQNIQIFADPGHHIVGEINRRNNGRGFYFNDLDGHNMEVFTVPPLE